MAQEAEVSGFRRFWRRNQRAANSLFTFLAIWGIFTALNPALFTNWVTYNAIFLTLPITIFLVTTLVFVIVSGELDLAFPSVMGFSGWMFVLAYTAGVPPFPAMIFAVACGAAMGFGIGALVVYGQLSSLVATLGLNFLIRGIINIGAQGRAISASDLRDTTTYAVFAERFFLFPNQMYWAIAWIIFCTILFRSHRFGIRVQLVGDNPESAAQMGVNVKRTRMMVFAFSGLGAGLAGVFAIFVNFVWWPTNGDGTLLPALAAVFVGGTPTWGGIGTVVGGAIGALTVGFIESGVVGVGFSGYYVQFFFGLIIILSIIAHRFSGKRVR
ncbi:MAG: ABC transporter permease [Pseudomonadota bacterium]